MLWLIYSVRELYRVLEGFIWLLGSKLGIKCQWDSRGPLSVIYCISLNHDLLFTLDYETISLFLSHTFQKSIFVISERIYANEDLHEYILNVSLQFYNSG